MKLIEFIKELRKISKNTDIMQKKIDDIVVTQQEAIQSQKELITNMELYIASLELKITMYEGRNKNAHKEG